MLRAAFLLSGDGAWLSTLQPEGTGAEDATVAGDLDKAATLSQTDLDLNPVSAAAWIAVARSSSLDDTNVDPGTDLRSAIIKRAALLVRRAGDVDEAAIALLKDALNHRLHAFAPLIEALVWDEMSSVPAATWPHAGFAFVYSRGLRPSDVGRVAGIEAIRAIASRISQIGARSPALTEQLLRAGVEVDNWEGMPTVEIDELPDAVVLEAKAVRALRRGDYNLVLTLADRLSSSVDLMHQRRIKRYVGYALLQTDRIAELASLIARCCVSDTALTGMLPIFDCSKRLDRDLRRERAGDLSIPIVLDFFSKRHDDSLDDIRSYAYEDFLIAHGLERPSQLDGRLEEFDRDLLIYYLRYVCVPGVMQISSAFQGTRELEEERKIVLSLLVKLNPESSKEYETELREVARAQLIHRGVRQVERSKIYVDVPAIRRAFEKAHRETFQRYQALSRAGMGPDDHELETAVQGALTGKLLPKEVLEIPKNEINDLLLDMLQWLLEECTGSPEHGLDCYLSMRIRHGTLSGQLRTPLEIEKIITQRLSNTGEYGSNIFWLDKLQSLDEEIRSSINNHLSRFSENYDNFIARIAGEMIQIQSAEKPNGQFRIGVRSVRFRLWVAGLAPELTFESFFDKLMDLFWESVEFSLKVMRDTIDVTLKSEINLMFAQLEDGIGSIAGGASTTDLDRAIRTARTGTLQALDIVKDWFRLSQPITEPDFPIGDLIDVGLQCVTAIHREFEPFVIRDLDPLPPIAGALVLFSDIFFIIFDNVRLHSGIGARPKVRIEVRDEGDRLRITARNEVAEAVRTSETSERIEAIRQAIAEGGYRRVVRSEGGTGLIKLRKLIGESEGKPRYLGFGFEGDEFVVELELSKREIQW